MEYLMTYGWAILMITVVLAIIFIIIGFSGSNLLGNQCLPSAGISCSTPVLNSNGILTISFGQNQGSTINNAYLECGNQTTVPDATSGFINPPAGTNYVLNSAGVNQSVGTLGSGLTVTTSLTCAGFPPNTISPYPIGTPFSGKLWLRYQSNGANVVNPVATFTVKVS